MWPGRLELALDARGGRFVQELFVAAESDVPLPGAAESWPEDVRVDGAGAPVFERDGRPALRLARGAHARHGALRVERAAAAARDPAPRRAWWRCASTGAAVPFPTPRRRGPALAARAGGCARSRARPRTSVEIEVHRRVVDEIPLVLETRITLRVSGAARDEQLGRVLPDGFVPTALLGPLPARLEPDGRLRVQVRPGHWLFSWSRATRAR